LVRCRFGVGLASVLGRVRLVAWGRLGSVRGRFGVGSVFGRGRFGVPRGPGSLWQDGTRANRYATWNLVFVGSGSVRGPSWVGSGSVLCRFGVGSVSVRGRFWVGSGSVRGRSGSVRGRSVRGRFGVLRFLGSLWQDGTHANRTPLGALVFVLFLHGVSLRPIGCGRGLLPDDSLGTLA